MGTDGDSAGRDDMTRSISIGQILCYIAIAKSIAIGQFLCCICKSSCSSPS